MPYNYMDNFQMGMVKWIVVLVAVGVGLFLAGVFDSAPKAPRTVDGWWARSPNWQPDTDTSIREFRVRVLK